MPFYHALGDAPELRHILVRHEQAAAHAADGYARASGSVGVCVATSGPGATNLVTGLATAHMDSSPVLAITGQVSVPMIGRDAFQETDVIGITLPITKPNWLVQDAAELADTVREAVAVALDGRPGPVLLDVPKDVQNQKAEYRPKAAARQPRPTPHAPSFADEVAEAARLIAAAQRPLLMVGHGVILAGAYAEIRTLAEQTGIPVITTLLGISAFPECHPLHLGMPGMHGEVHVNRAIQQADLIVGIGLQRRDGRRPAPDVGREAVPVSAPERPRHVGRPGRDGVRRAGGDGRPPRAAGRARVGDLGGRRLPDEHGRDRDHGAGGPRGEDGRLQQRLSRDGAAVAAVLPREALLLHAHLEPRLREAGRGVRHPRLACRASPRARGGVHGGERRARAGAGRARNRAGGERVPDDSAGGLAVGADRDGPGRGGHLTGAMAEPTHALSVLLDDDVVALNRAVGVVRRRNLPIASIAVGPSHIPGASRLTVMMQTDDAGADRMVKQLQKTYGVREAELLRAADAVAREVALVRVHAPAEVHQELTEIAELFKAELVDEGPDVFVLQVTGAAWFVLSFIRALERFGIIEVARSGAVAVRSAAPPSTSAAEAVL